MTRESVSQAAKQTLGIRFVYCKIDPLIGRTLREREIR